MTPICHIESAPRVPGCERGHAPKRYPAGRVCANPGCGTYLRRTHAGPICDPCQDNHRCGPPASDGDEVATNAAAAVRAKKEEATVPRDEIHNRCEDVLEIMRGGKWWTAAEIGERLGVSRQRVHTMTKELREAGHTIESVAGVGTRLVGEKLRAHSDEVEESAKTVPATPPAPAPVDAPATDAPEQPANEAPAPTPLTLQAPVPFAGLAWTYLEGVSLSTELRILDDLEALDDAERERVLAYAFTRWPGKLNLIHEVEVRYPSPDKLATKILDVLDRFARNAL